MANKILTILMIAALVISPLAVAQTPRDGPEGAPPPGQPPFRGPGNSLAPPLQDSATSISRQQALNLARGRFQGRVLSVRIDGSNWRVRIDQNGTVFNVFVDGRTGEVSRSPD
ncbi:MAG: PepSY domain-containing protein [Gammaproteobacteria bacterium]|nr:PepSY domain-containing protein [Gammaproteobacteria bacterium]